MGGPHSFALANWTDRRIEPSVAELHTARRRNLGAFSFMTNRVSGSFGFAESSPYNY